MIPSATIDTSTYNVRFVGFMCDRAMPIRTVFASNDCRATNNSHRDCFTQTKLFHLGIMKIFPELTVVGIIIKKCKEFTFG